MAFVVFTDTDELFKFEGKIAATAKDFVLVSASGARTFKTSQVQALMREDFAEAYLAAMKELSHLKHGDPEAN